MIRRPAILAYRSRSDPGQTISTGPVYSATQEATAASASRPIRRWVSRTRPALRGGRQASHRRSVEVRHPARHRSRAERDLGQERVAGTNERGDVLRSPAIAAVDQPGSITGRRGDADGVALVRVGDEAALHQQLPDAVRALAKGLELQGLRGEARGGVQVVQPCAKVRGAQHPDPPRRLELVAQVVAQRHQIDEVVRMQVAHYDGIQILGPDPGEDPWERSLAKVQQDGRRAVGNQVAGPRGAFAVRVGGPGAEHRQSHGGRHHMERSAPCGA